MPGGYSDTYTAEPAVPGAVDAPLPVIVSSGSGWTAELAASLKDLLVPGVLWLHLSDGDPLAVLDEEAMRAAGWVRA